MVTVTREPVQSRPIGRSALEITLALLLVAVVGTGGGVAVAQEQDEDAAEAVASGNETESEDELETVLVTGSRLAGSPSDLSRNVIVMDRQDIRASGEFTLARVLQQLPQNTNPTNATYGSRINGVNNKTGAATVNLRGLGSESTLILVDGRRVGYSGILGGVTDISTIPLSMVERIEILLDGASAVYGSDAVGGVVNIITRKDYAGVEVDVDYARPDASGSDENRVSIAGGFAWTGGRATVGYERYQDSGLDSSLRESIILQNRLNTAGQKNTAPGPQVRVWTYFYDESCTPFTAILWDLNGSLLSNAEYAALDDAQKASATCLNDLTLPLGFRHTDDLNSIDRFGEQHWGEEAEVGFSLLPEQAYDVVNVGIDQDLAEDLVLHANLRLTTKESGSDNGLNQRSGRLHANSPFNPFGRWVDLTGLAADQPPSSFESEADELFANVGLEGSVGTWTWQAEYGLSRQEGDTTRINVRHPDYGLGVNSDGVTHSVIARQRGQDEAACQALQAELGGSRYTYSAFFGGQCSVYGAPPDPIDPFGDISAWIIPDVDAGYKNQQTRFEGLVRGSLFDVPGGAVTLVLGYDFREDVLDSFSEFNTGFYIDSSSATGSGPFASRIARDNHAVFAEGLVPVVGASNASDSVQRLMLTFSARHDSISNVEVEYRQTDTNEGGTLDAADPGSKTTWSVGMVYQPADTLRFKTDLSTSFVAPQLNQLLARVRQNNNAYLWYFLPDGGGAIRQQTGNVIEFQGGNDKLTPETADTISLSAEFSPSFLPGAFFKASWSDTEFVNRIVKLRVPIIYLEDLPSNVIYNAAEDTYLVDNRWINTSAVNRDGIDLEVRYDWQAADNDFDFTFRRAYNNGYEVVQDASTGIVHDLISMRDDTGPEDTTLAPVPKHQTSMQFTWTRGGVFVSFDAHTAADTTIRNSPTREYLTEPAKNYDLVLSYEFDEDTFFAAPSWMGGMNATLTINNLGDSFAQTTNINPETNQRQTYQVNPIYEWTQGRAFRLSLHKSF